MTPQRVLMAAAPPAEMRDWRAVLDWLQAAAAFEHPLEIGAVGSGLRWLSSEDVRHHAAIAAFSSLTMLDVKTIRIPESTVILSGGSAFQLERLGPAQWQQWLRQADLQVLT